MRIKETKLFHFNELSDEAKEAAILNMADINISHEWWDFTYEDAAQVKLNLISFDTDRDCSGEFIEGAEDTAQAILQNHGACCPTHETATAFVAESTKLFDTLPIEPDDDGDDLNEYCREQAQITLDNEFLKDILEDYRIILRKEYEYLGSEEAIIETIEANEYEFTIDGQLS